MSKAKKPVLMVGGIPGDTAEEVFRLIGPSVSDLCYGIPDGEIGVRRLWILFCSYRTFLHTPDLECVRKPRGIPGMPEYVPAGYFDFYQFTVKKGVAKPHIETLHYPEEAFSSYEVFKKLRTEGVIAKDTRFQVCFPFPEDAVRLATGNADDMETISHAYADALKRDVAKICAKIPPSDLVIQWDINWETIAIEYDDYVEGQEPMAFKAHGDPVKRYEHWVTTLSNDVPKEAMLGLHICYGDLHHRHFLEPKSLRTSVEMANLAHEKVKRPIQFHHFPVPRGRDDDSYFAPLKDLKIANADLYIGLVHYTDGVKGTLKRLETFRKFYSGPTGVATECGLGRRPKGQDIVKLLQIHRDVAAAL